MSNTMGEHQALPEEMIAKKITRPDQSMSGNPINQLISINDN